MSRSPVLKAWTLMQVASASGCLKHFWSITPSLSSLQLALDFTFKLCTWKWEKSPHYVQYSSHQCKVTTVFCLPVVEPACTHPSMARPMHHAHWLNTCFLVLKSSQPPYCGFGHCESVLTNSKCLFLLKPIINDKHFWTFCGKFLHFESNSNGAHATQKI